MSRMMQMIDYVFARPFLKFGSSLIFPCIGIAISILFWVISPKDLKDKHKKKYISAIVIILVASFSAYFYSAYVQETYSIVPRIVENQWSFQQVNTTLINSGFFNVETEFDEIAEKHRTEGDEVFGYSFKVNSISPSMDSLVKKTDKIIVSVTWKGMETNIVSKNVINDKLEDGQHSSNNEETLHEDVLVTCSNNYVNYGVDLNNKIDEFEPKEFYGDIQNVHLHTYNSNTISLFISEATAKIDSLSMNHLTGIDPESPAICTATLYEYPSCKPIMQQTGKVGDIIVFDMIPNGIYYYTVAADGYVMAHSQEVFSLKYDSSQKEDILPWGTNLVKTSTLMAEPFSIQVLDDLGNPIRNIKGGLRVVPSSHRYNGVSYIQIYINDDGYVTTWYNTDNVDYYEVITCYPFNDYVCELSFDEGEEWIPVDVRNGNGIVILK